MAKNVTGKQIMAYMGKPNQQLSRQHKATSEDMANTLKAGWFGKVGVPLLRRPPLQSEPPLPSMTGRC
ncbi:hypothetical protein SASPL_123659 [Salvia splendens]|uniref:Uncharacterized protein n=1 Tax=Salvia splendens TaxID=180675 RepID=A0A8X8ZTE2_SALSN|nr:hypothetical protein SASPL_123659 [Salvia splendens]